MAYHRSRLIWTLGAFLLVALMVRSTGTACPVCFGDPESPTTDAMSMAVLTLLGVTGGMLTALAAFFLHLRKRAKLLQERFSTMMN